MPCNIVHNPKQEANQQMDGTGRQEYSFWIHLQKIMVYVYRSDMLFIKSIKAWKIIWRKSFGRRWEEMICPRYVRSYVEELKCQLTNVFKDYILVCIICFVGFFHSSPMVWYGSVPRTEVKDYGISSVVCLFVWFFTLASTRFSSLKWYSISS